ncbi:dimethylarginine dimethylaminohydrolase family protein [Natribacillus halophilus]|uniref:N-Dimethylarginine dimethylaminohydrolase n=1 Tax=Natribacillus halophilus TaxID=549003 RepID=A0A1G8J5L3_9BACI|nr:arginine deiminase family protein [Natribacillus halophilus]SDI26539.1 N-Dimethylarginine dimethylaminohydrolase [Natribacillus halophilus]
MSVNVQGERWFPGEESFAEEMPRLWGDWYCDSEVAPLKAVLMHRPGDEINGIDKDNYAAYRFRAPIQPERARKQQEALADIYREHGIDVHYVKNQRKDRPNAMYVRDLMFMTPEGAIIGRPGNPFRRGEEKAVAQTLTELGVPIISTINGDGIFEGACAMWIDADTVLLGTGSRANASGVNQVEFELRNLGVTNIIKTQIPYGSIHLDGYMNMVDRDKMVIFPWHVTYDCARQLMEHGIQLIEATNIEEIKQTMALNFVVLEPGKIVMPAGNPETKVLLEQEGIEVLTVEMDEIINGWGANHCMTAFLRREPLP